MKNIILASKSPRRIELFEKYGICSQCCPAEVDETVPEGISDPSEIVKYLAEKKAEHVREKYDAQTIVIAADTLVFCNGKVLGKPSNRQEAESMMRLLSDSEHSVISGVCIMCGDKIVTESVETKVVFRKLTDEEIDGYISTDEPYDKAGGYGIQALAGAFVAEINGDYYNVVGLPVSKLLVILRDEFGYDALGSLFSSKG